MLFASVVETHQASRIYNSNNQTKNEITKMKVKLKIFWLLFLLIPLKVASQIQVTGVVTDAVSNKPVLYATIYVNGTSNGTFTNPEGQFTLNHVIPPCEIVMSHISYTTQIIEIKDNIDTVLMIKLNPRDVELGVIEIKDKNLREENLNHFKKRFLGTDYWGKNAFIENDSVLIFSREKALNNENFKLESGILEPDSSSILFTAITKGPLLVNLPLLGYKLHINLVHYTELQCGNEDEYRFHTLGYFYFQPGKNTSKGKTNRFKKKQLEAWYNSDRHFCHSLFNERLKENGFTLIQWVKNPETGRFEFKEFEIENHLIRKNNEVKIFGLKNQSLFIQYFENFNRPVDLKREKIQRITPNTISSKIYFLKDTCTIRADGSRPDNSLMFGPKIGNKRVGAMLPYDFPLGN